MIYSPVSSFDYCGEPIFQVKDYPSLFVSRGGEVFSFRYLASGKHKIVKRRPGRNKSSGRRKTITFYVDGKLKTIYVHRLVCKTFNGEPPTPSHQVNHINENRFDNRAENLEWVTAYENQRLYWGKRKKIEFKNIVKIQNDTLKLLARDGVNQAAIARFLGVSKQAVNRRVQAMKKESRA